ncbi:MAG TPA: hypothetical protein VD996_17995 [Chitinophagaceae bacterium]|nr:hypothetical protein [Chitinophagaceae bacterium]
MKYKHFISFLIIQFTFFTQLPAFSQADSAIINRTTTNSCKPWFDSKQISVHNYSYIDSIQTHNYSGNWDFDGDLKADSLYFIGTGGAHLYFYLRIILSSDKKVRNFPFISLDFPCLGTVSDLKNAGFYPPPDHPRFVVDVFRSDGDPCNSCHKIYIHLDRYSFANHTAWKKRKINSSYLLLMYEKGKIVIKDFVR